MSTINTLLETLPQQGFVEWIGLRPARRAAMLPVERVNVSPDIGLMGDRYAGRTGNRQVTLLQAEHLVAIASYLGKDRIQPESLRRNIVARGINLLALKNKTFRIGTVVLEVTGLCHPCSRMEVLLGAGGYNAMRGHGGITARVVSEGTIEQGGSVFYPDSLTS